MYIKNKGTNRIEKIESTTFKQLGFKEREHLTFYKFRRINYFGEYYY